MTYNTLASGYTSPSNYYYVNPKFLSEDHRFNMTSYDIISNNKRFIKIDASKSINSIHKKIITDINLLI